MSKVTVLTALIGLSGALFVNEKGDNAARPDWKGDVGPKGGDKTEIVGFIHQIKNGQNAGQDYISLSVGPKDDRASIGLFVNNKGGVDTRPDYRGRDAEAGVAVSAWTKTDKNGKQYISLTFGEFVPPVEPTEDPAEPKEDDIPF